MSGQAVISKFLRPGQRISRRGLDELIRSARVVEKKKRTGAPKVILCPQETGPALIVKLWHPEKVPSSGWLRSYATRFRRNADQLRALGIRAPRIRGWGAVSGTGIRFVTYEFLPGRSLRRCIPDLDLEAAGTFVAGLHEAGVDFRSLHMGNILWDGADRFSLIDVTDCRFSRQLPLKRRTRRLAYFCGHENEQDYLLTDDRWTRFVHGYCVAAGLDEPAMLAAVRCGLPEIAGAERQTGSVAQSGS